MMTFSFFRKLDRNDKDDFIREILEVNRYWTHNLSLLLLIIGVALIIVHDLPYLQNGLQTVSLGNRRLFYLHLILVVFMLAYFGLSRSKIHYSISFKKLLNLAFGLAIAILSALFSINDQIIHGDITIYIISLFVIALVNCFNPVVNLSIYILSYIVFITGITEYQTNSVLLEAHYVNSAILVIIAWFLSVNFYHKKIKDFLNEKNLNLQKKQLEQTNIELSESLLALDESQNIVIALAMALESKDKYTKGHSERVAKYTLALADYLGLTEEDKNTLWRAAILHDIGKIGIPDVILNKPGRLLKEEWEIMKTHPEHGEKICSKLKAAHKILPLIRHHHERYDGKGYPDGLSKESIPFLARIIAIADMIDAVTSERPYRSAVSFECALELLEKKAGTQFDPALALAFIDLYRQKNVSTPSG